MRAILIPADEAQPITEVALPEGNRLLDALNELVGGGIESVPCVEFGDNVSAFINDDGKFSGLPLNARATELLITNDFLPGDYIAGDCVFCGFDPVTGDTIDLPEGVLPDGVIQ